VIKQMTAYCAGHKQQQELRLCAAQMK